MSPTSAPGPYGVLAPWTRVLAGWNLTARLPGRRRRNRRAKAAMTAIPPVPSRRSRTRPLLPAVPLVAAAGAGAAPPPVAGTPKAPTAKSVAQHPVGAGRYLVTFADEPAATYEGT